MIKKSFKVKLKQKHFEVQTIYLTNYSQNRNYSFYNIIFMFRKFKYSNTIPYFFYCNLQLQSNFIFIYKWKF